MKRKASVLFLALISAFARPCAWDSDTLAKEAGWYPDVVLIATGRFERNPPLYYQMRLDRIRREIVTRPDELGLYDDAGVAADRLGLGDEAIAWMKRKQARMASLIQQGTPSGSEVRYRTHANLGTFLIHRWLKEGGDVRRLAEAVQARAEIARAIEINPDAHFGRERVQLAVMDEILRVKSPPKTKADSIYGPIEVYELKPGAQEQENQKAIDGLLGLIALGEA